MRSRVILGQALCIAGIVLLLAFVPLTPRVTGLPKHRIVEACLFWTSFGLLIFGGGQSARSSLTRPGRSAEGGPCGRRGRDRDVHLRCGVDQSPLLVSSRRRFAAAGNVFGPALSTRIRVWAIRSPWLGARLPIAPAGTQTLHAAAGIRNAAACCSTSPSRAANCVALPVRRRLSVVRTQSLVRRNGHRDDLACVLCCLGDRD